MKTEVLTTGSLVLWSLHISFVTKELCRSYYLSYYCSGQGAAAAVLTYLNCLDDVKDLIDSIMCINSGCLQIIVKASQAVWLQANELYKQHTLRFT